MEILVFLEATITQIAFRRLLGCFHLVHAGAVGRGDRGIMLPAVSGAGKSTLVAALAMSGFDYYSDEVAILSDSGRLHPFPRAIALKEGGWRHIRGQHPQAMAEMLVPGAPLGDVWHVQPRAPSAGLPPPRPVTAVVLPGFDASTAGVTLERTDRSVALRHIVEQSMNLRLREQEGMRTLIDLVRRTDCYVLAYGDAGEAAARLSAEFAREESVGQR